MKPLFVAPHDEKVIAQATKFVAVIKLGRGEEWRKEFPELPIDAVEQKCAEVNRGAMIYAVNGTEGVLAATYHPAGRKWKYAVGMQCK